MIKKLLSILATAALCLGLNSSALALTDECSGVSGSAYCNNQNDSDNPLYGPDGIVTRVTQFATIAAGVVSVIVLILGGIKFITSGGSPQSVTSARNTILYASIGIVITLMAQGVVSFVLSKL